VPACDNNDAAETLDPLNESSIAFFSELGRKIASMSLTGELEDKDSDRVVSSTYLYIGT